MFTRLGFGNFFGRQEQTPMTEPVHIPSTIYAFFAQAATLEAQGQWQQLVDLGVPVLEKAATPEDEAKLRCFLANAYLSLKQYKAAVEMIQIALEKIKLNVTAVDLQARSLALLSAACRNLGQKDLAGEYIKTAKLLIAKAPAHLITTPTKIRVYINAGAFAQDMEQNYQNAAADYTKALQLMPLDAKDSSAVLIRLHDCFKNMPEPTIFRSGSADNTSAKTVLNQIKRTHSATF